MEAKNETIVLVTCIDSRLNATVDKFLSDNSDKKVIVYRFGGANVRGVIEAVERDIHEGATAVDIKCHKDCGAIALVDAALREGKHVSELVKDGLVLDFVDQKFASREELEKMNPEIQKEYLRTMTKKHGLGNVKITSELVDVSGIPRAEPQERTLIIAEAGSTPSEELCKIAGVNPVGAYIATDCVCNDGIRRVLPNVDIATKELHITRVVFVATNRHEQDQMGIYESSLKQEPFMKRASVGLACTRVGTPSPSNRTKLKA